MIGVVNDRLFVPITVMACLLVGVSCSSAKVRSPAATGGRSPVTSTAVSSSTSSAAAPTSTPTTFPKTITIGNITFHVPPPSWGVEGGPPRAYLGILAGGRGDVTLRVETGFSGTIDSLVPTTCLGSPVTAPARVDLVDQGFRPIGDRTAEFRFWRSSCPQGDLKIEEHRAWLLPTSQIAIFEQRHEAEVETVVATAMVR